jgi:hypothetical protein
MERDPTANLAPNLRLHWFQFRLRTMFAVTTLLALAAMWIGSQMRIVEERKWLRNHSHASFLPLKDYNPVSPNETWPKGTPAVAWFRELLGDDAICRVYVDQLSPAYRELNQLKAAFPEADIRVYWFGDWQRR